MSIFHIILGNFGVMLKNNQKNLICFIIYNFCIVYFYFWRQHGFYKFDRSDYYTWRCLLFLVNQQNIELSQKRLEILQN